MMTSDYNHRFQSDFRQFGGMLMVTGFCAIIAPLAGIVSGFGPDGAINTDASEIPFWGLVGAFCLFINGWVALTIGYMAAVHDWSHSYLTAFSIIIIQAAFIPYVTDMTNIGKMANNDPNEQGLIAIGHNPTEAHVKFVASMGVMTVFCYGFAFVGSMSFMAFCLHAYNTPNGFVQRPAGYFRGRMAFYCGMLLLGGLIQLALGSFCAKNYGSGKLEEGPVRAAVLLINYPILAIVVGLVQTVNALWGFARSFGVHGGPNDFMYQISLLIQWFLVICFQIIMQVAYLPADAMAPMAAMATAMSFGINMMPAFLDHKMRTTPEEFPANYYQLKTVDMDEEKALPPGYNDEPVTVSSVFRVKEDVVA